jgi:hypothetical protein
VAKNKTDYSELKSEVLDTLNQLMIKLKDIGEPMTCEDEYRGSRVLTEGTEEVYDEEADDYVEKPVKGFDAEKQFLACAKQMLKRIVADDLWTVAHNEDQYYTSNC